MTTETAPAPAPEPTPAPLVPTWGYAPNGPALVAWGARAIPRWVSMPVLTPTRRVKRRGGRAVIEHKLIMDLLADRQGMVFPDGQDRPAVRKAFASMLDAVVIPLVNQGLNGREPGKAWAQMIDADRVDLGHSTGIRVRYRAAGAYVYVGAWIVPDDEGWQEGKWSGKAPVPAPGDRVRVKINGIGEGTVLRRFVEHGYTGVVVAPDRQPDWHKNQNGPGCPTMVFGAEIEPV